jgi:hypothetical protein
MRYEIDAETFAIKIFNDGENIPFQFQPEYPNGDKFESVGEASAWAELSIAAHSPDVMEYAPNGKGLAPEVKPSPNAKAALLAKLGITADEAKLLLA